MSTKVMRLVVGAAALASVLAVQAVPITGSIGFEGLATENPGQTAFTGFSNLLGTPGSAPTVLTALGDYSSVPMGTAAIWTPFTFNPPAASVTPLWAFTIGTTVYSFDSTSMSVTYPGGFVNISGTGIAHITGFQDTYGTWTVTTTPGEGLTFTFGASTDTGGQGVPDGGMTVLLLGAALSGLALLRKQLV
ncbi:MAG TPA: hypothetical protein VG167_21325 [Verrucomicrobiae bacterium]|nr:hypothetical protein [Verrucomicrobiae bacterium]